MDNDKRKAEHLRGFERAGLTDEQIKDLGVAVAAALYQLGRKSVPDLNELDLERLARGIGDGSIPVDGNASLRRRIERELLMRGGKRAAHRPKAPATRIQAEKVAVLSRILKRKMTQEEADRIAGRAIGRKVKGRYAALTAGSVKRYRREVPAITTREELATAMVEFENRFPEVMAKAVAATARDKK